MQKSNETCNEKNKFSVNSLVESYKYEFLKNAELTFLNNNLKINFLPNGVSSNKLIAQNGFNDRFILQSGNSLFVDLLKTNKKSFYILDKSNKKISVLENEGTKREGERIRIAMMTM